MAGEVCNIGTKERRKRRLLGFAALAIGVAMAFLMIVFQTPRWSRIVIFFPLWIAGLGLLQAREKT
ncbi:MAG: hypothetical protein C4334_14730 [Pyrinomonas sp.]|uniref:hypothetical protein n=1 Tax=Pyrinomonas sp. TaxID=2080306 RepID=UPI0033211FCE